MLIDKTEIIKYRQISKSVRDDKINPHIEDAEFLDLKTLLGELLYNDIVANPTEVNNIKLLDPLTYTYEDYNYQHLGLKRVLCIFSYSRYVLFGSYTDTGFGFVEKSTQDSVAVGDTHKRNVYKKEQDTAYKYWNEIRKYLDRNIEIYPLWNVDCESRGKGIRISKITI